MSTAYIKKRLFNKILFNEDNNYGKMEINEKFKLISNLIYRNIGNISKKLKIKFIEFEKSTPFKTVIYFTVYTLPDRNHPIIGYVSRSNSTNEIILIRPVGKKRHHLDSELLNILLDTEIKKSKLNNLELYGLYLLIIKSIIIRKKELLISDEYSLLNCFNIKGCITEYKKTKNKDVILKKYQDKVKILLLNYFNHLENSNYDLAYKILGDSKYSNSEVNLILRKKKKIRGHLEIFISLYQLIDKIKSLYIKL